MDVQELRHISTHIIDGDINPDMGIVECPGDLLVQGDVQDESLILAEGDVEICGYIGSAGIRAHRSIIVHRGVAAQGYLDAGGDIRVQFANNSQLVAGGNIQITISAMHCFLSSEGYIEVQGDEGFLVGGTTAAACGIRATRVGSIHRTPTILRVGISPLLRNELTRLRDEIEELSQQLDATKKDADYLQNAGNRSAYAERLPLYQMRVSYLERELEKRYKRYRITQRSLDKSDVAGDIQVTGLVYPGVVLNIGWDEHQIEQALENVRFFMNGKGIQWTRSTSSDDMVSHSSGS